LERHTQRVWLLEDSVQQQGGDGLLLVWKQQQRSAVAARRAAAVCSICATAMEAARNGDRWTAGSSSGLLQ
jgi:hypothetical protein